MKEKLLIKLESGFIYKDNQIDRGRVFLDREKNKVNSLDERLFEGGVGVELRVIFVIYQRCINNVI